MKTASSTDRWVLADQREFLLRSLDDAAAEHAAGDLDDVDFALLERRDRAKLAEVEAQLAAVDAADAVAAEAVGGAVGRTDSGLADSDRTDADGAGAEKAGHRSTRAVSPTRSTSRARRSGGSPSRPGRQRRDDLGNPEKRGWRPRRRTWMGVVGAIALVAGGLVLVFANTSPRLPGQVATGGVDLSGKKLVEQELDQAAVLDDEGKVVTAIAVYNKVLVKHPRQSTALAEDGWLLWQSGIGAKDAVLEARGRAKVAEAAKVAPKFFAGHLFLGTIDEQQDADAEAVVQYRLFLADHPPSSWTRNFAPAIRQAFTRAAQPLPAGVPDK